MLSRQRHQVILELIERQGSVTVADLCQYFSVSDMTIRRDLAELERSGLIRRVYGGAISTRGRSYEPPFPSRLEAHRAEKERIGQVAASLIRDGDSIALDVGTTTLEVARHLQGKHNLTIITNSLHIASVLANKSDIRLIITGGIVRANEMSMTGHLAEHAFRDFYVDKLFLGIGGIHFEAGLTEFNLEDALVKRSMLSIAKERILVADASKFGQVAFAAVAPLSAIDKIITDSSIDPDILRELREKNIEVILA